MPTWANRFQDTGCEAMHRVIARPVDRIEAKKGYEAIIHWRMTAGQFPEKNNEVCA